MSKLVTLTIDSKNIQVPGGTLIVDAAKKIGIDIPVFCFHPKMEPVGMCRMCLVEVGRPVRDRSTGEMVVEDDGSPKIQFNPNLETACTTTVSGGMVVRTDNTKVKEARKDIIEFTLTSHPLDCPVCDKGGECSLQDITMEYGSSESRFTYDEKRLHDKHVPLGDLILLDRERCIQCGRCVRFQTEIAGDAVIGFNHRGSNTEIVTFSKPGFDSYFSGNTTDICPVGALTTVDFRFKARPWEMEEAASLCPQCPVGCNTVVNVRREAASGGEWVVKRVMPRQNEKVNEIWICDKGRFAHHFAGKDERLKQPQVRKNGELTQVNWKEAIEAVTDGFKQAGEDLLVVASGRLSNEDLYNAHKLSAGLKARIGTYTDMAGGDLTTKVGLGKGSNFADMKADTAILVIASDLEEEAPIWSLRVKQAAQRGVTLIVANPRSTKLDNYAKHVLRYPYGMESTAVKALINGVAEKNFELSQAGKELEKKAEFIAATKAIAQAENAVVLYGCEGTGLKSSQYLAEACAHLLITTNHVGKTNNGLVGVWQRANDQGAWDLGLRPIQNLDEALQEAEAVYVIAADPVGDDRALADALEKSGAYVVVQEIRVTATAEMADVVLPVKSHFERDGSFTSGERRVQRYYQAVTDKWQLMPDFALIGKIGSSLGLNIESDSAEKIMTKISADIPDYEEISYASLAEYEQQLPEISQDKLYYAGTSYENCHGVGVQLTPSSQRGEMVSLGLKPPEEYIVAVDGLLAVPTTHLYDYGNTVLPSKLLSGHLSQSYISVHSSVAQQIGIADGEVVLAHLNGSVVETTLVIDNNLPDGIVLVPRSYGIPISGPTKIEIEKKVSG